MGARLRAFLFVVGAAGILSSFPVPAARLPDWAATIVDVAPPIPEGVADDDYRTLLHERRVVVLPDGSLRHRLRSVRQALNSTADEIGLALYPFGENANVLRSRGWHLPPEKNGRRRAEKTSRSDELTLSLDDSFTSDAMARVIGLSGIDRGSLVFFEFEAEERPYALSFDELFFLEAPLAEGRLEIELPPGWSLSWEWLRHAGPEPLVEGTVYRWELRDLPGRVSEELGDSLVDLSPALAVGLRPPEGTESVAPAFDDWPTLARWYARLAEGRYAANEAIGSLGTGAGEATELDRIFATAREVRDRVRYVAKEVGIGGYQPRQAVETLDTLYGDCKDKSTLLIASLAVREVRAFPVLVNLTRDDTVAASVPTLDAFDHLIVAVPLADLDYDGGTYPAILPESPWGPLLFIDTTDEHITPGWMSSSLSGKTGLIVTGEGGGLAELPGRDPEAHRQERGVTVRLTDGDAMIFERIDRLYGEPANAARAAYRSSSADRESAVRANIKDAWLDASVESHAVEFEAADGAFVETVSWTSSSLEESSTGQGLRLFPGARDGLPAVSVSRRETDVVYDYPRRLRWEVIVEEVPAGTILPAGKARSGDGWSVTSTFERDGSTVSAVMELALRKTRFTSDDFRDLRQLYSAVKSIESAMIVLP